MGHIEKTRLKPIIDRGFGFDEVPEAVHHYETGAKLGKIVIGIA